MSSINSSIATFVETDRKSLCELLKSLDCGNDDIYTKLLTAPIPEIPKDLTKSKKEKKVKSDAPRRKSGYILFSNDFRLKAKNSGTTMNSKDLMRAAGDEWKVLDDEQKKIWTILSQVRFDEDVNLYQETHPDYDPSVKPLKASKKVVIPVPRGKSPYVLYVSHLSKSGTVNTEEDNLMTLAAANWKTMSDEEKKPFIDESLETKKVAKMFRRYVNRSKSALIDEGIPDEKKHIDQEAAKRWNTMTKEDQEISDASDTSDSESEKPKKVPIPTKKTAYNHFVAHIKGTIAQGEKLMTVAGEKWGGMSDEEKKPFVEQSKETNAIAIKFKEFVSENESRIKEEINDVLEKIDDDKKKTKMIRQKAAELWADM